MTTDEHGLAALLEARLAIAEAATPGPWERTPIESDYGLPCGGRVADDRDDVSVDVWGVRHHRDSAFIAANDPDTVKLLIDLALAAERRRQARAEWDRLFRNQWERSDDAFDRKDDRLFAAAREASDAEDAALATLHEHLSGGG